MNSRVEPSLRTPGEAARERGAVRLFVRESNRIEGINRPPLKRELEAHVILLACPHLTNMLLSQFVSAIQPGAQLRIRPGMDVRVGNYIAPPGGQAIGCALHQLLTDANEREDPYEVHCRYETLHPFIDGNGRSGRAVWLWQMLRQHGALHALRMGFLHLFYYQTLDHLPRSTGNRKDGAKLIVAEQST